MLADAQTLSNQLAKLAQIGHAALGYLAQGTQPPAEWKERSAAVLAEAAKPVGPIYIAVTPAIRSLVEAAGGPAAGPVTQTTHQDRSESKANGATGAAAFLIGESLSALVR